MKIQIDAIQIKPGRREADREHIRELADSIRELGLLNPITVDRDNTLIAGLHRLEAAKLLSWSEIECNVSSLEGLQAELAEIDENFVRSDLSTLEYGEMLLRRKEIYEMLHPETKARNLPGHASNYKSSSEKNSLEEKSFVQDTAKKLGVVPRTVELQIQTAKNLTPEAKEIIKGTDTKITKNAALKLSRLQPEQQQEAAALLAAKEIKTVDEYRLAKTPETVSELTKPNAAVPEPEPIEKPAPVPAAPYTLPEERCASLKEMVAELKDTNKDCGCTPDMFLAEYAAFVQRFDREIVWYSDSQYEAACSVLTPEQMDYLRQLTDTVCAAAQKLYSKIERMTTK